MADIPTFESQEAEEYYGRKRRAGKGASDEKREGTASRWLAEIEKAEKRDDKWIKRGRKIVKRFRDDRADTDTELRTGKRKFNILWSNYQTLFPSILGRAPIPIAERRFLDHDPVGRIGATILERTVRYDIEYNGFYQQAKQAVGDYLLPGRGIIWSRYEPRFGEEISPKQEGGSPYDSQSGSGAQGSLSDGATPSGDVDEAGSDNAGAPSDARPPAGEYGAGDAESIVDECVYDDYVFWEDFLHSQARVWSEVTWIARRIYMGKGEIRERAKTSGKKEWLRVPITRPRDAQGRWRSRLDGDEIDKAEVFEIWCKETRRVHFIARGVADIIETRDDPLGLEDFWPTPRPLYATQTNDTTEPVPDYAEYQDQAEELDSLTNRIASLTRSLKVAGAYDASASGLQRILDEGVENKLVPVVAWAAFAEKGGINGAISWMPIKDIAAVLIQLFEARERVKQDLYEITGIADIIRGQSDPRETLGAQEIKGSFATQRLGERQQEVARYLRDVLCIHAEIAAEHYAPETLILKSSILEDDGLDEEEPTPEAGPPGMGHNGGPPMDGSAPPMNGGILPQMGPSGPQSGGFGATDPMQAQAMAAMQQQMAEQAKLQRVMQSIALLKDEKLRGFRIDIETDSTIAVDQQKDKETAVEFVTAVSGYVEKMALAAETPAGIAIIPFAGAMLGWAVRRFRTGRDLEAALDRFLETANQMVKQAAEGGQEDPALQVEQVKAQAEIQKTQMDGEIAQLKGQIEIQKMQMDMAKAQATAELEKQMAELKIQLEYAKMQMEMQKTQREEELAQAEHSRQMQLGSLDVLRQQEAHRAGMEEQQAYHQANMEGIAAKKDAASTAAREKASAAKNGAGR